MKTINQIKYLVGKQKLGRGMSGVKGGVATPTGAFGGKSKFNKRLEKLKKNLTNNK
tara:strand:+ start:335 stop:502 length:168 start_codon:yes stop_codon:yes gene_type:complete